MTTSLPNLSCRQLQAVRAVARYSSFVAAAAELELSQPGLSRIIRSVEEALGVRIFHRSTRHVTLTPAGAEFLGVAERVLRDLELATDAITSRQSQTSGHVALACPMSIANRMIVGIVVEFKRQHPNVRIEIREGMQGEILNDIRSGAVDFGIGIAVEPDNDLATYVMRDTGFHVIFRNDHPFRKRRSVNLTALRNEKLISLPPSSNLRWMFDGAAGRAGFRLNHAITVNTYNSIFEFVRAREGVSVLTDSGIAFPHDKDLSSRPINPPRLTAKLATMHMKTRPLTPAAKALKDTVERHFSTIGPDQHEGRA